MTGLPEKIIIATNNQGKVREIRDLVQGLPIVFLSLADFPDLPEVVEDGATFEENALKKARAVAQATGTTTLADDSGLCVDALGERPGIHSARYGGQGRSDEQKCRLVLDEMRDVPDHERSARFVCVLGLVFPDGNQKVFRGVSEGSITRELKGSHGFGYDPIFYFEEAGCTFAEMDSEAKNRVSHRGRALRQFASYLKRMVDAGYGDSR
jgi:XTP/dITP diphosphohydrolase